jgi:hypothetical protein
MEKMEFGGPEWTQALCSAMRDAFDGAGDEGKTTTFSMSEEYRASPAHLVGPDGQLGWHVRITGGQFAFELSPSRQVDVFISADYQSILPLARFEIGTDEARIAERDRIVADLSGSGRLVIQGDLGSRPSFLEGIHDSMARVTA